MDFFLLVDDDATSLAHHLPRGFLGNCVLTSAYALGCRLVVDKPSSNTKAIWTKVATLPQPSRQEASRTYYDRLPPPQRSNPTGCCIELLFGANREQEIQDLNNTPKIKLPQLVHYFSMQIKQLKRPLLNLLAEILLLQKNLNQTCYIIVCSYGWHMLWLTKLFRVFFMQAKYIPEVSSGAQNRDSDRKKRELAKASSGEKFRAYVEYSPVAVFVTNSEGKQEYVNEAAAKLLGYSKEELLKMNISQLLFKEDILIGLKEFSKFKKTGRYLSEAVLKTKDGQPVYVIMNAIKLPDGRLLGFCENITERKKTENALRMSEAKVRIIVENSSDLIFVIDKTGKYLFVNKRLADSLGKPLKGIIGKSILKIYSPETAAQFEGNIKNVFATGKSMVVEEKMVLNNQELTISTNLNPVLNDQNNVIAVTGIARDITERVKAERELRESEERFRVIFEGANDGILVADIKTERFVLANPQMCQMVGYPLEELLKMSVPDIHPKEFLSTMTGFEKMATGEKMTTHEVPLLRADKQIVDCEVNSAILEIWKQQCLVGFFRDITERKQAEKKLQNSYRALEKQLNEINMLQKKLEKANKLLTQSNVDLENYTYVVSHDLKAPLRAIRSFSSFILEDYEEKLDETGKDYFQRIINASKHMDELIENLLLLSRVGRKFMEVETVDLNQLIEEIMADLEATLKKKNGKIVFRNLPKVNIPRTWMKQLFMNLIDNGLKFNKSKAPTVEVTCVERDAELLFRVSDNGIGIEKKYFDRLFNLFERLHTQEEYPGTGAGLTICKRIVQEFGGKIWVESQVGKGTTFFFTLPKKKKPTLGGN